MLHYKGHARTQFERQLQRLEQDTLRMGALVESSCQLAHVALFERDMEAAAAIAHQDKQIDVFYRQIEMDCVNLIAMQSPVALNLRLLSAQMQLIRDLERIGDYAKDLGDIARKLFPYPMPQYMGELQIMSERCRAIVSMSLGALANLDAEMGLQIKQKDDVVDADYRRLYALLAKQNSGVGSVEPAMLMVLAIHHMERIADHATNIGQRVGFIVTGTR
ncbi:MAG: phosphate signaling complex protein PhoU [Oscillatoriales cyanobacterium SM2_2_1]|nr:phosphate signaling complex protein PhoU [Oscillatoriales cyanobacterium SM2_2_1]